MNVLPTPYIVAEPSGRIHTLNMAAAKRLGGGDGATVYDLFAEDDASRLRTDLTRAARASVWQAAAAEIAGGPLAGLRQRMRVRGLAGQDGPRVLIVLADEERSAFRAHTDLIVRLNAELAEQRKLRISLEEAVERERYLHRELIHRVKNNLTLLSALLNHWIRETDSDDVEAALRTVRLRIDSIALVHKLLDDSATLEVVNAEELIGGLCDLLGRSLMPENVTIRCTVESLRLHNEDATTLCILINELVTNSLKHAFRGRASGEIELHFRANGVDKMELRVRDDGHGMPSVASTETSGGTAFLHALARGLGGELLYETRAGTEWTLIFRPRDAGSIAAE